MLQMQLVFRRKRTANDLSRHKRLNLATTCDAFEPMILGVARQSNVQDHFRPTLLTLNTQAVL